MPVKTVRRRHSSAPRHKHTKPYLQAYWPYIPMLLIILCGLVLGSPRPTSKLKHGTLAYSTGVSSAGLLEGTNAQRSSNGKATLKLNSQLSNAAQAKANDMIARNYWSHNTPDGEQPWVFFKNAGYKYTKAGENLAYGFATSVDVITGWMNSASHKANMLDGSFSEVGFGFANGSDYNSSGPETVVVAEYGQPQVLSDSTTTKTTTKTPTKQTVASTPTAPVTSDTVKPVQTDSKSPDAPTVEPASKTVTRAQTVTKGKTPWIVTGVSVMTALGMVLLLLKHGLGFRRLVKDGENFILKHPLVDTVLVAIIMLGYVLSATTGIIK